MQSINQKIDAWTLTKKYYNQAKNDDEILECVKRDMKHHHPEILSVMLGLMIWEINEWLSTDCYSIDFKISELAKVRGYLKNQLQPIKTRENRLFTPERVAKNH